MGGWVRYFELKAKAKTGFSTALLIWAVIALVALVVAIGFLIASGYIWLANRYGAQVAALIMAGVFFVIAVLAGIICMVARNSAVTQAKIALAERKQPWLDPAMLGVGLQVGRSVGWGRLLSLGAVAILAAGLGREWLGGRGKPSDGDDEADDSDS